MMNFKCKKCDNEHYYLQENAQHIGAYCTKCNAWITWVSHKDLPLAEKKAERFLRPLHIDKIEKVPQTTFVTGPFIEMKDPPGPQGSLGLSFDFDAITGIINKLKYWAEKIQNLSHEMGEACSKYEAYNKLLEEALKGGEDDTPPWE